MNSISGIRNVNYQLPLAANLISGAYFPDAQGTIPAQFIVQIHVATLNGVATQWEL
jgi:hypothetical protein